MATKYEPVFYIAEIERLNRLNSELLKALEAVVAQIDPKDTPVGLGNYLNARDAIYKARDNDLDFTK